MLRLLSEFVRDIQVDSSQEGLFDEDVLNIGIISCMVGLDGYPEVESLGVFVCSLAHSSE